MGEGVHTIGSKTRERNSVNIKQSVMIKPSQGLQGKYISDLKGKTITFSSTPNQNTKVRILGVGDRKGYYRFDIWETKGNKTNLSTRVYDTQESQKFIYELSKKHKYTKID